MRNRKLFSYEELDSTNDEAKRLLRSEVAANDMSAEPSELYGAVITARRQTNGRGRLGRSFASPGGDSIYASFILEPPKDPAEQRITAFAAVAVCLALEKTTSYKPGIKWINDIYIEGKKICGILAESVPGAVILGIGININLREEDMQGELFGNADSLSLGEDARTRFESALWEEVFRCMAIAEKPDSAEAAALMKEYRARSIVLGKAVVLESGHEKRSAFCEGHTDDGALILRYSDGSVEELRSGDVTVRLVS